MADEIAATKVTPEMAAIVGKTMRESVSHPVAVSDIRKWAIAVYYPDDPPRLFWDEEYAATTPHGGIVAPEEFNPFAWATQKPAMTDPKVAHGPPPGFPKFHDVPGGRYVSDEFYELEQEHLWTKSWVMAGRVEDIPEAGDYFVFKDLGDPLLVVQGTDAVIRCFYNTCRHRGAPVVREDQGSARRLRCQYHSWTYEIDGGTLVALPDERDLVDLDWTERSLPKVSCDTYHELRTTDSGYSEPRGTR